MTDLHILSAHTTWKVKTLVFVWWLLQSVGRLMWQSFYLVDGLDIHILTKTLDEISELNDSIVLLFPECLKCNL